MVMRMTKGRRRWRGRHLLLLAILVLLSTQSALACPSCSESLDESEQGDGLARGFAYSIYLMIAVPMVLVGGGVVALRRQLRREEEIEADRASHGNSE